MRVEKVLHYLKEQIFFFFFFFTFLTIRSIEKVLPRSKKADLEILMDLHALRVIESKIVIFGMPFVRQGKKLMTWPSWCSSLLMIIIFLTTSKTCARVFVLLSDLCRVIRRK